MKLLTPLNVQNRAAHEEDAEKHKDDDANDQRPEQEVLEKRAIGFRVQIEAVGDCPKAVESVEESYEFTSDLAVVVHRQHSQAIKQ